MEPRSVGAEAASHQQVAKPNPWTPEFPDLYREVVRSSEYYQEAICLFPMLTFALMVQKHWWVGCWHQSEQGLQTALATTWLVLAAFTNKITTFI